jgi:hypothetical protein
MNKREKLQKKIEELEAKIIEHKEEITKAKSELVEFDKNSLHSAAMKSGLSIEKVIALIPVNKKPTSDTHDKSFAVQAPKPQPAVENNNQNRENRENKDNKDKGGRPNGQHFTKNS